VDHLGDDFLAGAVFAEDQHGQFRIGHAADGRAERADGRTLANELHALFGLIGHNFPRTDELLHLLIVFEGDRGMGGQLRERRFVVVREVAPLFVDLI
jgi:hypothetical protein